MPRPSTRARQTKLRYSECSPDHSIKPHLSLRPKSLCQATKTQCAFGNYFTTEAAVCQAFFSIDTNEIYAAVSSIFKTTLNLFEELGFNVRFGNIGVQRSDRVFVTALACLRAGSLWKQPNKAFTRAYLYIGAYAFFQLAQTEQPREERILPAQ